MSRILLTGMSGVGKSTVMRMLESADTLCLELDDSEWMTRDPRTGERLIRTAELIAWLEKCPYRNVVLAVCESNQHELYAHLSAVIVMTAPLERMRARILERAEAYGKSEAEWAEIVYNKAHIEPLLIPGASYICDTDRPPEAVLNDIRAFLDP